MVKRTLRKKRSQRGGNGFFLGVDGSKVGGQATVMRYSECPATDALSKDYPNALYNAKGGCRRCGRRSHRRSRRSVRK